MFYQNILNDLTNLPEHDTMALKPKLRHTCEKYNQIKVPCKYRTVIDNLRRNKYLVILKQVKVMTSYYLRRLFTLTNAYQYLIPRSSNS